MATSLPQPTAGTGRYLTGRYRHGQGCNMAIANAAMAIAKAATAKAIAKAIATAAYQQRARSCPNCKGSAGLAWVRVRVRARLGQG